jgi:hypothetical protein
MISSKITPPAIELTVINLMKFEQGQWQIWGNNLKHSEAIFKVEAPEHNFLYLLKGETSSLLLN